MRLRAGYCTHTGQRRENNEDSLVVDDRLALFAVADGMGGHRGGEVASATAIEALRAEVANGKAIDRAIEHANVSVWERASRDPELAGMGTTMTAVLAPPGRHLVIGHVGDSRAYLVRDGVLEQLTDDHSLVGDLLRDGVITKRQAEVHPQKAIITRAVGLESGVEVAVYSVEIAPGDRIVVCSDGLSDMLRDSEIERIAAAAVDAERAAQQLVDAANEAGGDDNITVVILDIESVDDEPEFVDHSTALLDAVSPVPTATTAPEPETPAPPKPKKRSVARRMASVLPVLLPVLIIAGVAAWAASQYARNHYYAKTSGGEVIIMRGRPGGYLGWDPTVERATGVFITDLPQSDRAQFSDGIGADGSLSDVEDYVDRLAQVTTTTLDPTTTLTSATTTVSTLPPTSATTTVTPATRPRRRRGTTTSTAQRRGRRGNGAATTTTVP